MVDPGFPFVEDERCRFRPVRRGGLRVVLRLTGRCDLSCPHCLSATSRAEVELDTEAWLAIMRQLPDIGTTKALLTGGEPLLREDIVRFVEVLAPTGIATDLNSNLQRMTRPLMRELKHAGLSEISISLEGPEDIHDRLHGRPGAYARLMQAVEWAAQAGVEVDASCCLTRENEDSIGELMDIVRDLPIRSLTFSRLLPIGHGGTGRLDTTPGRLAGGYELIRALNAGPSPIPLRATGLLGPPRPSDCGRGTSLIGFAPDGRLLGCVLAADNPRVPHPLKAGLRTALLVLRRELAGRSHELCWWEGP